MLRAPTCVPHAVLLFSVVSASLAADAVAQRVSQVVDLDTRPAPPLVPAMTGSEVAIVGDQALFFGSHPATGEELWRTDGTLAGTELVKDIFPGPASSAGLLLRSAGDVAYFFANAGTHGYELWRSDGTTEGTSIVRDVCRGSCDGTQTPYVSYNSAPLVVVAGRLFFRGNDGVHGEELWCSDGTPAGTWLVKDIRAGSEGSSPRDLVAVGDRLFLVANDGAYGWEVWVSDGTEPGTHLVRDLVPGPADRGITPMNLTAFRNGLAFFADDGMSGPELWWTDGTAAGTVLLKDICPGQCAYPPFGYSAPLSLAVFRNRLYFSAGEPMTGVELWSSDGTPQGSSMLVDACPGPCFGFVEGLLIPAEANLFFQANDGIHGRELWVSDGTPAGTHMIADWVPGSGALGISSALAVGRELYFIAGYAGGATGLWRSDGTSRGTRMVTAIEATGYPDAVTLLGELGGRLLLRVHDRRGAYVGSFSLWLSDGTRAGTGPLFDELSSDLSTYSDGGPRRLTRFGDTLVFTGDSYSFGGYLVWRSDGTAVGTFALGPEHYYSVGDLVSADGTLFYSTYDELWKSDGTLTGTAEVCFGRHFSSLRSVGKRLFMREWFELGDELATSDGTVAGTQVLKDICPGSCSSNPVELTPFGSRLFFDAVDSARRGLWASDGTPDGTVRVADIGLSYDDPPKGSQLTVAGSTLFFAATRDGLGTELWRTDGTEAGTWLVRDICPGACSSLSELYYSYEGAPRESAAAGAQLFFQADDGVHGKELWRSDGSEAGTVMVADLTPGPQGSLISNMAAGGGRLFFALQDETHGRELWVSNGTAAGTAMVADLDPGPASSDSKGLTWVDGLLFFSASDGVHGRELWRTDGTPEGTALVADIFPGPASSAPAELLQIGRNLYFTAYHPDSGRELWTATPMPFPTLSVADASVREGDVAGQHLVLDVSISTAPVEDVTVEVTTADGTAIAGQDYLPTRATLHFPAGSAVPQQVGVTVLDDGSVEESEWFHVVLSEPENAAIVRARATVMITDDDQPPASLRRRRLRRVP